MKRSILLLLSIISISIYAQEQEQPQNVDMPKYVLKTNALYWATTSLNVGAEFALSEKITLDALVSYNPWAFSGNKKFKYWLLQPEIRYWATERFNGHFFGLHIHFADYNVGGIKMLGLQKHRYQGYLYGGGISYGYHWILNKRWSLEGTIGLGYAHLDYSKYDCAKCGKKIKEDNNNYWGPTKVAVNLIYVLE